MDRSRIITDLISERKSLSVILHELLVIVSELENKELNDWVKSELNGYTSEQNLPEYRKNLPYRIVYSGLNGRFIMTNQPLSIKSFGEYEKDVVSLNVITSSILELENINNAEMIKDLTPLAGKVQSTTGIICYSINLQFGKNVADIILSNVKTKVIESLLLLEKEFGILDSYLLDLKKVNEERVKKLNDEISSVIFSNGGTY